MTKYFIFIFLYLSHFLFGGIDEYLKPAENKYEFPQMSHIDFIYVINLDRRPEKFAHCVNELAPHRIFPYRFSAVNGWEIPLTDLNQLGVKYDNWMRQNLWGTCYLVEHNGKEHHEIMHVTGRNYFCHCMSRGAVGIVLSHLSILQDAYNSGYERVWVMEDDIQVMQNPHLISDRILQLNSLVGETGWDLLFTDRDTKNQNGDYVPCLGYALKPDFTPNNPGRFAERRQIGNHFIQVGARYGAYSYIINRQGMKKILDFIKTHKIFLPYDMEFYLPDDIRLFAVIDDIVSTLPQALSDNGAPNYLNTN